MAAWSVASVVVVVECEVVWMMDDSGSYGFFYGLLNVFLFLNDIY